MDSKPWYVKLWFTLKEGKINLLSLLYKSQGSCQIVQERISNASTNLTCQSQQWICVYHSL